LTAREQKALQLIAERKSNKGLASALFVTPTAIETHRGRIMDQAGSAQHRGYRPAIAGIAAAPTECHCETA